MATPFTEEGKVDEDGLKNNIDWFIEQGVDGVDCTGSTGEFYALSTEEREKVMEITINQAKGKVGVLIGTAAASTEETIKWTKLAEDMGADGAMIVSPYYSVPTDEEIYEHYKSVAEAVEIPLMPYNNPATSGVDMSPELICKMGKEIENVLYVKEASGDARRAQYIIKEAGDDITVFWGEETNIFAGLALGSEGWISGAANIVPEKCKELFDLIVEKADLHKAKKLYYELIPLFSVFESGRWLSFIKEAMNMLPRVAGGKPRRPTLPLSQSERDELKRILEELNVI
jgi:4-hydroxy-tetrahydrodipicolinate synthase